MITNPSPHRDRERISNDDAALALQASSVIATVCVSPQGELLSANSTFTRLLRFGPPHALLGRNFRTEILAQEADWQHWERAIVARRVSCPAITLLDADARDVVLRGDIWAVTSDDDRVDHLFGVLTDATRASRIEDALRHTARAEAVARLTSSIAGDCSSLLDVLLGNLQLVAEAAKDDPASAEHTKLARAAARSSARLVRDLLEFTDEGRSSAATVDPAEIVSDLEPMLAHVLSPRALLTIDIDSDAGPVEAGAAALENAIVNLVLNAADAIPDRGNVGIVVRNHHSGIVEASALGLEASGYVSIAVIDDGEGISESLQSQVFEPFFSTRSDRAGAGLGLSTVRWLAESWGGTVTLSSRPGHGTTVTLLIPSARLETPGGDPD